MRRPSETGGGLTGTFGGEYFDAMSSVVERVEERVERALRYPVMFARYFLQHPYSPLLAHLVVTRRCNLKCGYCNEFDRTSSPVERQRLERSIDVLGRLRTHAMTLTGGEPTLHPELPAILAHASRVIPKVSMITNGYKLSERLIRDLGEAGLGRMQISLDGIEPNETTAKVLRCTKDKLELLAAHASFKVHINAVLGSIPFEETLEIVQVAKSMGFETTVQWLHDEHGQALNPHGIGRAELDILKRECQLPIYHSGAVLRAGLEKPPRWKCRAGSRYLYIDEHSVARYCSQARDLWACPVDELDESHLEAAFYTAKPCAENCTIGCVRDASRYDLFRRQ